MATRFELVGLHRLKLLEVRPLQVKMGQKEMRPAVALRLRWRSPATSLDMIDPCLRPLLFKRNSAPPKAQPDLEGVPAKTELTPAGVALRVLHWQYEQTGCKFIVHEGVSKVVLKDCTVKKQLKLTAMEGDAVDIEFSVFANDVDEETMGALGVRKMHEIEAELTLPEVLQQQLPEGQPLAQDTPIGALARNVKADKRQPAGAH